MDTDRRRLAGIEAVMVVAQLQLAEADGRIVQARGRLQQAIDEREARAEVQRRSPGSIAKHDVQRFEVQVESQQGALDAALAGREAIVSKIEFELPAQKATAEAWLHEAEVALEKTLVKAGSAGLLQQFALNPGDVVNPMMRPAGILVPDRRVDALLAGFGQIEAQVLKAGMIAKVTCIAKPWTIIPMVITGLQHVIASGQIRATNTLVEMQQFSKPGTIIVIMEPLYPDQLDDLPLGGTCIANAYTSNHGTLQDPEIGSLKRLGLHAIDTVGLVHAMLLRMQALLISVKILVVTGH